MSSLFHHVITSKHAGTLCQLAHARPMRHLTVTDVGKVGAPMRCLELGVLLLS